MKKYILYNSTLKGDNNAGSKAGRDAVTIAENCGYHFVELYKSKGTHTTIRNVADGLWNTWKLCCKLKEGDIVFLQYPVNRALMNQMYKMLNCKKVHLITLIHDIDFLRDVPLGEQGVDGMKRLELSLLSQSEYLICHNDSMIDVLKQCGLKNKLISLDLFDYLYEGLGAEIRTNGSVIVAGNLTEQKAGYLYKLKDQKFSLALYGSGLKDGFENRNAVYYGSFSPDELIPNLRGSYGLVWDGSECDTCAGSYGKYLRINNPHKASLYLAAGLPVIVWKESALYPFVKDNKVGFGVVSLDQIDEEIERHDWSQFRESISIIQGLIRTGSFLTETLKKIEKEIMYV